MPDVRFLAEKATCSKASGNQSTCELAGDLVIRGRARPFTIALKVTEDKGSYHPSGHSIVKLSTYGIEQPSQLGVRTADDAHIVPPERDVHPGLLGRPRLSKAVIVQTAFKTVQ